jgi:hypothetical protein
LQLYVEDDNLSALNLYARTADAFTDESEQVGLLFAAIAYAALRKETQLAEALVSRDLIGQAKGILMERYKISGERAFLVLTGSASPATANCTMSPTNLSVMAPFPRVGAPPTRSSPTFGG